MSEALYVTMRSAGGVLTRYIREDRAAQMWGNALSDRDAIRAKAEG